jgi:hypothetical protein
MAAERRKAGGENDHIAGDLLSDGRSPKRRKETQNTRRIFAPRACIATRSYRRIGAVS